MPVGGCSCGWQLQGSARANLDRGPADPPAQRPLHRPQDVITTRWITTFEPTPLDDRRSARARRRWSTICSASLGPDIAYRFAPTTTTSIARRRWRSSRSLDGEAGVRSAPFSAARGPTDHRPVRAAVSGSAWSTTGSSVVVGGRHGARASGLDRLCGTRTPWCTPSSARTSSSTPAAADARTRSTTTHRRRRRRRRPNERRLAALILTHYVPAFPTGGGGDWRELGGHGFRRRGGAGRRTSPGSGGGLMIDTVRSIRGPGRTRGGVVGSRGVRCHQRVGAERRPLLSPRAAPQRGAPATGESRPDARRCSRPSRWLEEPGDLAYSIDGLPGQWSAR